MNVASMPRRPSEILAELEKAATAILVTSWFISTQTREVIEALRGEIAASLALPAEGERLLDDTAAILATACWHLCFEKSRVGFGKWHALAALMLGCVRENLQRAREMELKGPGK